MRCTKCGSVNVTKLESQDNYRRFVCNDCENTMVKKKTRPPLPKEDVEAANAAPVNLNKKTDVNENSEYQPTPLEAFSDEFKSQIQRIQTFAKSINSSNYKEKLFNAKMAVRYVCVAVVVVTIVGAYKSGENTAMQEEWLRKKSDYNDLVKQTNSTRSGLKALKNEQKKLQAEVDNKADLVNQLNAFASKKEEKESEISELESQISDLETDKNALEKDITNLSDEVDDLTAEKEKLTGEIAKAKGKGYTLTAGKYTGGDDIPVGTYNINWISGHGNVFVGRQVNEMFGSDSSWGYIKSYKNAEVDYLTEIEISGNVKVQFKAKD